MGGLGGEETADPTRYAGFGMTEFLRVATVGHTAVMTSTAGHPEAQRGICCYTSAMLDRTSCVYLLASRSRVLYCGVTSNLERRVREHRAGEHEGFTKRYHVHRLVYVEQFRDARAGIARERLAA